MKYRPEYDLKIIGENLKRLRESKSLSVKDVQEYLRLGSVQAIYKYESGKGYPQTDTMFALMELYDADLSDIVRKHDENVYRVREAYRDFLFDIIEYKISNSGITIEKKIDDDFHKKQTHRYICYLEHYKKHLVHNAAS